MLGLHSEKWVVYRKKIKINRIILQVVKIGLLIIFISLALIIKSRQFQAVYDYVDPTICLNT